MSSPEPETGERPCREYRFAGFTLDLDRRLLQRGEEQIPLRPKTFDVLVCLVENHGKLAAKDRLIETVWSDVAVTDNSLAQCLVEIRRALGDDAQQLIRTIPGRGYIFAAQVSTPVSEFPRPVPEGDTRSGSALNLSKPKAGRLARVVVVAGGLAVLAILSAASAGRWPIRSTKRDVLPYTQITNFTDSAVSPALSPDGRMLAFIRSENGWLTTDQIYVKLMPDGEPIQLTHDPRPKYAPVFSLDGSRIAYTVVPWSTYVVSPLGGEPSLLVNNSSGLTWLDRRRVLFSEVSPPHGLHMGVITALEDRSAQRTIYFPQDERGMVHLSYASPDRKWVLAVEMNPVWLPCRLVSFDGRSAGRQVGPTGRCTSAAWSPDGSWMYFGVDVNGGHHLWRQRFPNAEPEQITSGPTEEDGVAIAPDGRSLITSIGMQQNALWIHDAKGDRALSFRGNVAHPDRTGLPGTIPVFSRDGKSLFYLRSESPGAPTELWKFNLDVERSEKALPGVSILEFSISDDATEVVYSAQSSDGHAQIWIAPLDRSTPPQLISPSEADSPHFGPNGRIVFRSFDGTKHYLAQMDHDGSARSKLASYPIGTLMFTSPDRHWITTVTTMPDGIAGTYAVPVDGGTPQRICSGCPVMWAPDAQFLYLAVRGPGIGDPGKTRVVPLRAGKMLPRLPPLGIRNLEDSALLSDSFVIDAGGISPGPDPSVYAYVKTTMHRNLFQIPLH